MVIETDTIVRDVGGLSVSVAELAGQGYIGPEAAGLEDVGTSFLDPPWGLYLFVGRSAGWSLHNQLELV